LPVGLFDFFDEQCTRLFYVSTYSIVVIIDYILIFDAHEKERKIYIIIIIEEIYSIAFLKE
jgi:hypothetical protein